MAATSLRSSVVEPALSVRSTFDTGTPPRSTVLDPALRWRSTASVGPPVGTLTVQVSRGPRKVNGLPSPWLDLTDSEVSSDSTVGPTPLSSLPSTCQLVPEADLISAVPQLSQTVTVALLPVKVPCWAGKAVVPSVEPQAPPPIAVAPRLRKPPAMSPSVAATMRPPM